MWKVLHDVKYCSHSLGVTQQLNYSLLAMQSCIIFHENMKIWSSLNDSWWWKLCVGQAKLWLHYTNLTDDASITACWILTFYLTQHYQLLTNLLDAAGHGVGSVWVLVRGTSVWHGGPTSPTVVIYFVVVWRFRITSISFALVFYDYYYMLSDITFILPLNLLR